MSTQSRDHLQQPSFQPINWSWPDQLRLHWVVWVFALVVAVLTWVRLPEGGNDWIRGAALAARDWWPAPWLHNFPLAPWGALLFSPVATAPDRLGTVIGNFLSVIVLAMVIRRFGGPDWIVVLVMLTPAGYFLLING